MNTDIPDFETPTEQLLETAGEREAHYFKGQKLHPYSFCRRATVIRLIGEPMSSVEFFAAVILVCMKTADECDRLRGDFHQAFRKEIYDLADRTDDFEEEVQRVGLEIVREANAGNHKLKPRTGQPSEGSPDPNG
jgi:hypothetical protein